MKVPTGLSDRDGEEQSKGAASGHALHSLVPAPIVSPSIAWLGVAGFWGFYGLLSGIQVWLSMLDHGHSVPRLVGYYILTWEAWIVPTWLITKLVRRFPVVPLRWHHVPIHVLASLGITVAHCLYGLVLLVTIIPFDKMNPDPKTINLVVNLLGCLPLQLGLYCLVLGFTSAVDYYGRYRERSVQAALLEASLSQARLRALELQLQPHFLFNTLNAIFSLVKLQRNSEAMTMIGGLSELLRYTLDHEGQARVRLAKELTVLQRYLDIQRTRFNDRMTFAIDADPSVLSAMVPTLVLQPLVENAIGHGIAHQANGGEVKVKAWRAANRLHLEVYNTGSLAAGTGKGIGIRNTQARLQHLYGNEWTFTLNPIAQGVVAALSLPWSEDA